MSRPLYRRLLVAVPMFLIATLLGGCSQDRKDPCSTQWASASLAGTAGKPYVLLVDRTRDEAALALPASVRHNIEGALGSGSPVSVGIIDGRPGESFWLRRDAVVRDLPHRDDRRDKAAATMAGCLAIQIDGASARTPQTDVLAALVRVGDQFSGQPATVDVVSNGLSNTGLLDLRRHIGRDETAASLVRLIPPASLPRLHAMQVTFHDVGQVAADRSPIPQVYVQWLRDVWKGVCAAAQGTCSIDTATADVGVRPAGTVADAVFPTLPEPALPDPPKGCVQQTELPTDLLFRPGSAAFTNLAAVDRLLTPIAARLRQPGQHATVSGHTATWGTVAYRENLSRERAGAVLRRLTQLHAPADSITARWYGSTRRKAVDTDANGVLLEPQASRNRRIEILFATRSCT